MSTLDFIDKTQLAETRGKCYEFLASIYNLLPSVDFMTLVRDPAIYSHFISMTTELAVLLKEIDELKSGLTTVEVFWRHNVDTKEQELIQRLAVERTRLFRGVAPGYGPQPPYESVYREGQCLVMGKVTLDVKNIYKGFAFCPPEDYIEPVDYVGIELDFLGYLCKREAAAWDAGEESRALDYLTGEKEFLDGHLLNWVPDFCNEVINCAKQDFYRGMAQVTKAFVIIDAERLKKSGIPPGGSELKVK